MFRRTIVSINSNDETKRQSASKVHENHFDKKVFDTINCPEYLKKHLNLLKLSLFSKRYKFVFHCRKIKLFRANAKISSVKN